jgi:hypothetical protein
MELRESRRIIGEQLNKDVLYCCWPHGNYNQHAHDMAMKAGYRATTIVLGYHETNESTDRFDRIGHGALKNNERLTLWRIRYKVSLYRGNPLARLIHYIFLFLRYGSRKVERSHSEK